MMDEPEHQQNRLNGEVRATLGLRAFFRTTTQIARDSVLDLIFPPRCAGCGRIDTVLCARCSADLAPIAPLILYPPPPLTACAATGAHDGILRRAIHALKYEHDQSYASRLAVPLAARMVMCLENLEWQFDIVISVPLYTQRLQERGYNQSELLGAHVAAQIHIPFSPTALNRRRDTASQVGRDHADRLTAMRDAFRAVPKQVEGLSLLLIDDVFTTGATLQACAEAAIAAGAHSIYSLTLSSAQPIGSGFERSGSDGDSHSRT